MDKKVILREYEKDGNLLKMRLRIILVLNNYDRENRNFKKIQSVITRIHSNADVYIIEYRQMINNIAEVLDINPHIIVTFPFTAKTISYHFYIIKHLLNCVLVCFRTEGLAHNLSSAEIRRMIGLGKYGSNIIDYEIFWGRKTAELIGKKLLEQNKISSQDRIRYFGNPYYEDYFKLDHELDTVLPNSIRIKLNQYPCKKRILFITGFHLADYTPQDLIRGGDKVDESDKNSKEVLRETILHTRKLKRFRQEWINAIITSALKNPELLFVVKTHTMEYRVHRDRNLTPYAVFYDYDNVLLIEKPISFRLIIAQCSILFQYGSTTKFESYLSKVPSVFVHSNIMDFPQTIPVYAKSNKLNSNSSKLNLNEYEVELGSALSVDIDNVASIVSRHAAVPIQFQRSHEVENYLDEMLELRIGEDYNSSERIARFLLSCAKEDPQLISSNDKYLAVAFLQIGDRVITDIIKEAVSKLKTFDLRETLVFLGYALDLIKIYKFSNFAKFTMVVTFPTLIGKFIRKQFGLDPDQSIKIVLRNLYKKVRFWR